ncbi:hypothetical protein BDR26DRAFT_1003403 [Obelidium mucronatum]|nr:hypothetical protein BDR26DRAFT_1003403 [Obelidium mucronatum]
MTVSAYSQFKRSVAAANAAAALACFSAAAPTVVCAPSGQGADGSQASLAAFVKAYVAQREHAHFEEQILSTVVAQNQLVEEALITLVHDSQIDWILPNVKPTRKRIVFPLVTIVHFDASSDKIQTLHMYWDQGTVLRQIGVLPNSLYCKSNSSEVILPVLGPRIVDRLKEPYNNLIVARGPNEQYEYEPEEESIPAVSSAPPRKPTSSENIFGTQEAQVAATRHEPSAMGNLLSQTEPVTGARPSSRVIHRPGGPSSNIFNTEPEPVKAAPTRQAAPFMTDDQVQQAAPVRKTGRRDPNWSSLSEPQSFDDAPLPNAAARKSAYHTHNETHWDMGGSTKTAHKTGKGAYHNPNETQHEIADRKALEAEAAGYEAPNTKHFGRKMSAHAHDHNNLFGGGFDDMPVGGNSNSAAPAASGMVGAPGNGLRDRNALSEPNYERPSSKVLAPPGGKTSILFG